MTLLFMVAVGYDRAYGGMSTPGHGQDTLGGAGVSKANGVLRKPCHTPQYTI